MPKIKAEGETALANIPAPEKAVGKWKMEKGKGWAGWVKSRGARTWPRHTHF